MPTRPEPTAGAPVPGPKTAWFDSPLVLPICLAVGVLMRLALVMLMEVRPHSDAGWYFSRASELAAGLGYQEGGSPTAFWPVGYPAFLAGLFTIFGTSVRVGQLANIVLWALTLWMLHRTVLAFSARQRAANLAVLCYCLHLNAVGYTGLLLTETLFVTLLVAAWWLSTELRHRDWRAAIPLGVLLGLMTLIKAQTWVFALIWAGIVVALSRSSRRLQAMRMGIVVLTLFATVAPWSLRNLDALGSFVLVSTNGGVSLAASNHARGNGSDSWSSHPERDYIGQSVRDQVGADRRAREVTWRWIRDNPTQFLALAPRKFWWALVPDGESEWGYQAGFERYDQYWLIFRTLRWINQLGYCLLAGLVLWSAWRLLFPHRLRAREQILPLAMVGAYGAMFLAITFVFNGQSRYHFPLIALACGVCGWAISLSTNRTDTAPAPLNWPITRP